MSHEAVISHTRNVLSLFGRTDVYISIYHVYVYILSGRICVYIYMYMSVDFLVGNDACPIK